MTPGSGLLRLYRGSTPLLGLVARPYLARRLKAGKEDPDRMGERLGHAGLPRPPGPLVWVHGASVGEALAVLPLIGELTARGLQVLLTTGTLSSAAIVRDRLPRGAVHQFVPLDVPAAIRRFLDHWSPALVLLTESELWPNLVGEVADRAIPLVVVNARMSARSFGRWQRLPGFVAAMLGRMTLCLAQTADDAGRLSALGAPFVQVTGNLKFDGPPPPADEALVADLRACIGRRPVWIAASIHPDEEGMLLAVHARLHERFADVLSIVVPRHAYRGAALLAAARQNGSTAASRAASEPLTPDVAVYVADTMGELGLFYRLGAPVFVGKSLAGGGGQNPLEPAKLGVAILHGPDVANFKDVYAMLGQADGAVAVPDGAALADTLANLLHDPSRARAIGAAAKAAVVREAGGTGRTMAALAPYLAAAGAGAEA